LTTPQPDPVRETLAQIFIQLAAHRGQLKLTERELGSRIDEVEATVTAALDGVKGPAAMVWDGLEPEVHARQVGAVMTWASDVLFPMIPSIQFPPCWPGHRDVLIELGNAMCEWVHIYSSKRPQLRLALDYYDRWLPGILRRASVSLDRCRNQPKCHHLNVKRTAR
jgi:hypothetical protein